MGRAKRADQFRHDEVGIAHCIQRCVRRAYLAGDDAVTGKSFEYRREWIRRRLELLAAVFGVDVLSYAVLSNHLHLILRTRPDVVKLWSDEEIATRWLRLFPGRRLESYLGEPTKQDIAQLVGNAKRLTELRKRLSDISWFMRALCEPIARQANREDQCTGRFWEGRFKLRRSSTKQVCWLVLCMLISIQCEQPWLYRLKNRGSLRLTIGLPRSEELYWPPLLGSTSQAWTVRILREALGGKRSDLIR